MVTIYIPTVVKDLAVYNGNLLTHRSQFPTIKDHLMALSERMWEGVQNGIQCVKTEFNNYHPDYLGLPFDADTWNKLSMKDCQQALASEYGYNDWEEVEMNGSVEYDENVHQAIDCLLNGDVKGLELIIADDPDVINRPTQYGHQARLIHYCGSNGVEMWRQRVPMNLPEMVQVIIQAGADINSTMKVYGGSYLVYELAATSAHPAEAGIKEILLRSFMQ